MQNQGQTLNLTLDFKYSVPNHIMYKTLTDQMELCRMQQGPAISEPREGGKFSLYDGMISGTYTELKENVQIKMKWRMKDWVEDCFSVVVMDFEDCGDDTVDIKVTQSEIPEYDQYGKFVHLDNLEGGWKNMIFQRIEQVFGYPQKK